MSVTADEFLAIADQFKLGDLVTEQSHPITAELGEVAGGSAREGLRLLFEVDGDVVRKYRRWAESGKAESVAGDVLQSLRGGGRVFFTGCGATGRLSILLDSMWREHWRRAGRETGNVWNDRTVSLMAGGDYALIKSVEGFEDFAEFGKRQMADAGVRAGDIVFAITEGGETPWVIGTAWAGLEVGGKVYFVYCNPDEPLRAHVKRSREVIDESRIEKINLATGPMAITGSTRMQATSIQLCALATVLEIVADSLMRSDSSRNVPAEFARSLEEIHGALMSDELLDSLARLIEIEQSAYRSHGKANYYADRLAVDVLTDTTERSPTFSIPSFRKHGDAQADESWAFLFTPASTTRAAWHRLLGRTPNTIDWSLEDVRAMVGDEKADRQYAIASRIGAEELMRFRIGVDGLDDRPLRCGDAAIAVTTDGDEDIRRYFEHAREAGARTGIICAAPTCEFESGGDGWPVVAHLPTPPACERLGAVTRVGVKMLLNALSTCIMARLGRVRGNYMIYVAPTNLKLIDRATRYVERLAGLSYEESCRMVFEAMEEAAPLMAAGKAHTPVIASVLETLGIQPEQP